MDVITHRENIRAWLMFLRAPGLGPATLRGLLERYGTITQTFDAVRTGSTHNAELPAPSRAWFAAPDDTLIEQDLAWLAAENRQLLTWDSEDFPPLLKEVPSAPVALFVVGESSHLWAPQIAIVGSRNATQAGLAHAKSFARAFVTAGFTVTSGLAEGIDGAAHTAALEAGGMTIAALGTGPDIVYPSKHRELAARILSGGALVTEFPPGTSPRPEHFPRRNRIISGLSLGTLVIEASLRSGSLITARVATDQGREVFALPGSIHNPLARGCHRLIREGAKLVETAEEVIDELAPLAASLGAQLSRRLQVLPAMGSHQPSAASGEHHRDPDYNRLLAALNHDSVAVDQLAERTGLSIPAISSMLLMLELEGEVLAESGGMYMRASAV